MKAYLNDLTEENAILQARALLYAMRNPRDDGLWMMQYRYEGQSISVAIRQTKTGYSVRPQ